VKSYLRWVPPKQEPSSRICEYCQTEIPERAVRCPNCTSQLVTAESRG
jgi:RNA polymerase subunit RPABC4/transcription elongation factor Spt4